MPNTGHATLCAVDVPPQRKSLVSAQRRKPAGNKYIICASGLVGRAAICTTKSRRINETNKINGHAERELTSSDRQMAPPAAPGTDVTPQYRHEVSIDAGTNRTVGHTSRPQSAADGRLKRARETGARHHGGGPATPTCRGAPEGTNNMRCRCGVPTR